MAKTNDITRQDILDLKTMIARAMRHAVAAGRARGEDSATLDERASDAAGVLMRAAGRTGTVDTETLTVELDETAGLRGMEPDSLASEGALRLLAVAVTFPVCDRGADLAVETARGLEHALDFADEVSERVVVAHHDHVAACGCRGEVRSSLLRCSSCGCDTDRDDNALMPDGRCAACAIGVRS